MGTGVHPERRARLREPYDPPPGARLRVLPLLVALVAATAAALAAPLSWPAGASPCWSRPSWAYGASWGPCSYLLLKK